MNGSISVELYLAVIASLRLASFIFLEGSKRRYYSVAASTNTSKITIRSYSSWSSLRNASSPAIISITNCLSGMDAICACRNNILISLFLTPSNG